MDGQVIHECEKLSSQGKITFPEVVQKLLLAGVEMYYVDLMKRRNTYYGTQGETLDVELSFNQLPPIQESFNAETVSQTVKRVQRKEIDYATFLQEIMKAGTYAYTAYLRGRRVAYLGRTGEMQIEYFPSAK